METSEKVNPSLAEAEMYAAVNIEQVVKTVRKILCRHSSADDDQLYGIQQAASILEYVLRPFAIDDLTEISNLFAAFDNTEPKTFSLNTFFEYIATTGALRKGHFELLSGLHSEYFFMFNRLGSQIDIRKQLAREIASRFVGKADMVVAPVTAGGLLLHDVGEALAIKTAFVDVDEQAHPVNIRPGYSVSGNVLVVNDMTTSGESLDAMLEIIIKSGAKPCGIGLVAVRGTKGAIAVERWRSQNLQVEAISYLKIEGEKEGRCQKCLEGEPFFKSSHLNR